MTVASTDSPVSTSAIVHKTDAVVTSVPTDDGKTMGSTDVLESVAKTSPTTDIGSGVFDSTTTEAPVVTSGISAISTLFTKVPSQSTETGKIVD